MTVYCVFERVRWHGDHLLSVHATAGTADAEMKRREIENGGDYFVEEREVLP